MILTKDKDGNLCLLANHCTNYPFKMEGMKLISVIEVPKELHYIRANRSKVKDVILFQKELMRKAQIEIEKRKELIKFLEGLQSDN